MRSGGVRPSATTDNPRDAPLPCGSPCRHRRRAPRVSISDCGRLCDAGHMVRRSVTVHEPIGALTTRIAAGQRSWVSLAGALMRAAASSIHRMVDVGHTHSGSAITQVATQPQRLYHVTAQWAPIRLHGVTPVGYGESRRTPRASARGDVKERTETAPGRDPEVIRDGCDPDTGRRRHTWPASSVSETASVSQRASVLTTPNRRVARWVDTSGTGHALTTHGDWQPVCAGRDGHTVPLSGWVRTVQSSRRQPPRVSTMHARGSASTSATSVRSAIECPR